ncbi:MAG TPA: ATP-binding protein [Solirubrobacteraceae bacterium]|nr:ATP-binding protein [Solirubrobacteraceae bacterium]
MAGISNARAGAVLAAAFVAGLGVAALQLTSDHRDPVAVWVVFAPAVCWSFVITGLYAWRHRPESRIGALMVALGFAWLVFCLQASDSPVVYTIALVFGGLWGSLFLQIGLSFPTGRLPEAYDRALVLAGYVIFPLAFVPPLLFYATPKAGEPETGLLIADEPRLGDVLTAVGALSYVVLFVLVLRRAIERWRATTEFERLQVTPVYVFSLLTFALVTIAQAGAGDAAWWPAFISTALMPFAYLAGLLRSHVTHLDHELQARVDELRESRARVVSASDAARRRLERDLHDGAQSRLVALALLLRSARLKAGEGTEVSELLDRSIAELQTSLAELRDLARGIHPAVLTERGLEPALASLAGRAPVPVTLDAPRGDRLPEPVESAAYFVASEGLANVAKYSHASHAAVTLARGPGHVTVEVSDDGIGGADFGRGSGLRGLEDRIAALDGTLELESPPGRGTRLRAQIPVRRVHRAG